MEGWFWITNWINKNHLLPFKIILQWNKISASFCLAHLSLSWLNRFCRNQHWHRENWQDLNCSPNVMLTLSLQDVYFNLLSERKVMTPILSWPLLDSFCTQSLYITLLNLVKGLVTSLCLCSDEMQKKSSTELDSLFQMTKVMIWGIGHVGNVQSSFSEFNVLMPPLISVKEMLCISVADWDCNLNLQLGCAGISPCAE